ncbi:translation elongation factor Ts [Actinokineospora sp. G85]|uniref:translation elongation factor Ts n=1 Tax=Actinokineospora sp. G85 TaxID=3406626 RepID=UPI003C737056
MSNFTAADVKRLRDLTGAGMMDCKKALTETDGDFDKAIEILRIKGAKDVGKRAERATAQGLVAAADGVLVELNCETDFVAKNDEFIQLADKIVAAAKAAGATDLDSVKAAQVDGKSAEDAVQALSAKIGEKLELRRAIAFTGTVSTYLHRRSSDLPPAVGVLVEYTGGDEEAARAAALQIAAMKPRYLSRDEVPADVVANERRIAEETAREEGKPEAALPKITEGRVNGFYKDVVLGEQASVLDSKKTVQKVLDEAGVTVTRFARFEVGQA